MDVEVGSNLYRNTDGMIEISWPDNGLSWSIYATADLSTPANSWARASGSRVFANGRYTVTLSPAGPQRFFRLSRP